MSHNQRKYAAINVVQLYSTLTLEHWRGVLLHATKTNNINKLIAWRYGLQAGLSDAVAKGFKNEKMEHWVIKRCANLEKCMRFILKKKYKHFPGDPKKDPTGYVKRSIAAKRVRDTEFERFLQESAF